MIKLGCDEFDFDQFKCIELAEKAGFKDLVLRTKVTIAWKLRKNLTALEKELKKTHPHPNIDKIFGDAVKLVFIKGHDACKEMKAFNLCDEKCVLRNILRLLLEETKEVVLFENTGKLYLKIRDYETKIELSKFFTQRKGKNGEEEIVFNKRVFRNIFTNVFYFQPRKITDEDCEEVYYTWLKLAKRAKEEGKSSKRRY